MGVPTDLSLSSCLSLRDDSQSLRAILPPPQDRRTAMLFSGDWVGVERRMRLGRVQSPLGPRLAQISDDCRLALPPGGAQLPGVDVPPLEDELALHAGLLLVPLRPGKIVAVGRNYPSHAEELGNSVPSRPLIFLKAPSSVVGPGEPIVLPPDSRQVEHEAELGIVIGARCRHVARSDFSRVVAGYVAVNDVTARDLQKKDGQFARAKGFDSFCPLGPWLETDLDPSALRIRCRVNGELRQDGSTEDMAFPPDLLIAAISRVMTLHPGDVLCTGTPAGVGPLSSGDVVEVDIRGLGVLENPVVAEEGVPFQEPPISEAP